VTVSFIRPVLLVEESETTDLPQVADKLYHIEITLVLLPINNSQVTVDEKLNQHMTVHENTTQVFTFEFFFIKIFRMFDAFI
jgi:hypothetical protein